MPVKRHFSVIILLTMVIAGCSRPEASLIVCNATVYTVDSLFTKTGSFAVVEGKIAATGTTGEILSRFKTGNLVDLQGKYVYPGFIDAHAHFYGYGMKLLRYADLAGSRSQQEVYDILQEHYRQQGGTWLVGRGWDQNDWPEKQFPGKAELDRLFPDVAVYLIRVDGHAGWCNSQALTLAGVTADTRIPGGEVLLKEGEPTGILIDNAMDLVSSLLPSPDRDLRIKALLAAQENCLKAGLTSVTDCGIPLDVIQLMDSLQQQGRLKIRINAMINPDKEIRDYFAVKGSIEKERLRVKTVKIYADGALGSRGALLLEPYTDDPGNRGLQVASQEFYNEICTWALQNDFQVSTHCIGDSANRLMLQMYAGFLGGENDKRWRIEHAQVIHPDDFSLFARYSVVPSVQATHATSDMEWAVERLGPGRIPFAYAYRLLLQQTGWIPNGTDFPIEEIFPLYTFYASTFRKDHRGQPEEGFQPENRLTREEAIRSMTLWAARASFEENIKGSLEPGKWADFVVLDTDLLTASPEEILNATIHSSWIAGEKVF